MAQQNLNDASVDDAPPTFDVLPLSHEVRRAVDALGYTHPTPVQRAVFESVAQKRDVVVQARTGTGKTAAFGLPCVDRLVDLDSSKPQILVLSPTRELALQINRELTLLGKFKGVQSTAVYGGAAMQPQIDAIAGGAHIIAGTPGRVLDHLERGTLKAKSIKALVLDESDEMLSMGFLPQITKIMEALPDKHQTLLFSATLPPDVKRIADSRLTDPEFITLSGDHVGALSIDHFIYRSTGNKADELISIIEIENPESAIVFCNTRDQTKQLATALQRKGYAADWLNADLAQKDREKVMAATREGRLRFLVCTDVAARGIDISHLTHVINADFPESTENYVHRTGRTGRAGRTGTAISMIAPQDVGNLYMLRLTYKIFPIERDLPRPGEMQTRRETDLVDFLYRAFNAQTLSEADRRLARRVLTSDVAEIVVAGLLKDHLGGHPDADRSAAEDRRETLPASDEQPLKKKKKDKKKKKKHKAEDESDAPEAASDEGTPAAEASSPSAGATAVSAPTESALPASAPHTSAKPADRPEKAEKKSERPRAAQTASDATEQPAVREKSERKPRRTRDEQTSADGDDVASKKSADPSPARAIKQADSAPDARVAKPEAAKARRPSEDHPAKFQHVSLDQVGELEVISASSLLSKQEQALLRGDDEEGSADSRGAARTDSTGSSESAEETRTARIFVNVGLRDDITEEDFLDTLADNSFPLSKVQRVELKDSHSFVIVSAEEADDAVDSLDGEDVGGLEVRAERARPPLRKSRSGGGGPGRRTRKRW